MQLKDSGLRCAAGRWLTKVCTVLLVLHAELHAAAVVSERLSVLQLIGHAVADMQRVACRQSFAGAYVSRTCSITDVEQMPAMQW